LVKLVLSHKLNVTNHRLNGRDCIAGIYAVTTILICYAILLVAGPATAKLSIPNNRIIAQSDSEQDAQAQAEEAEYRAKEAEDQRARAEWEAQQAEKQATEAQQRAQEAQDQNQNSGW
jgi:uncharacterized protein YciI